MKNRTIRQAAFTLIELLVTIAIVAVLASLLLPVIAGVRRHSDQAKCTSNLRQIGASLLIYANENEGSAPMVSGTDWPAWIWKLYDGGYHTDLSAYACPSDTNQERIVIVGVAPDRRRIHASYGVNENFISNPRQSYTRIIDTVYPAVVPLVADCTAPVFAGYEPQQRARIANANDQATWTNTTSVNPAMKRHSGGSAVCFVDGHVRIIDQKTTINGDPTNFIYRPKPWGP